MYRYLTTLLLAGVAAVILTAAPANAFHKGIAHGGGGAGVSIQTLDSLDCSEGEIARFIGGVWVCSGAVTDLQAQIDDLFFFIDVFSIDGRLVFAASSGSDTTGNWGGSLARTRSATPGRLTQGYLGRIRLGSLIRTC